MIRTALVVCTKNRLEMARALLASVAVRDDCPEELILVVGADDRSDTAPGWEASSGGIRLVRTSPGLTHQRMVGLASCSEGIEVVHFLDDDAAPLPGYFRAIEREFDDLSVVGAGGVVVSASHRRPTWIDYAFMWRSRTPGRVTIAGCNTDQGRPAVPLDTGWLSGCAMSMRRGIALEVGFDTSRRGYGLGEDVDMSLRLRRRGRLRLVPAACVVHEESPIGRLGQTAFFRDEVLHRWKLSMDHDDIWLIAVVWATLGRVLLGPIAWLAGRRSALAVAAGSLQGLLAIRRAGRQSPRVPESGS